MNIFPILQWPGGKKKHLKVISELAPKKYGTYIEPFLGGGAVFCSLRPEKALLADINPKLIDFYDAVKNDPNGIVSLVSTLKNEELEYYRIRDTWQPQTQTERAARLLYLNRHCFNGVYRENASGKFNVAWHKKPNKKINYFPENIKDFSEVLRQSPGVSITCEDWLKVTSQATTGDFIYLDPPYYPANTGTLRYAGQALSGKELSQLRVEIDRLTALGCYVMLTNSNTEPVLEEFKNYNISILTSAYTLSCSKTTRTKKAREVIILNY